MANENLSFKLVTDNKNTFFTNNKFITAESLPVEGDYIKGDIIVNIGETSDTEAMWVCVESGNPGIWEVVGSGVGGGGGGSVSCRKSRTTINGEANEVNIGLEGFNKSTDTLLAFANARLIVEGVDYSISNDGKIVSLNGNWNKQAMNEFHFDFIVFEMGVVSNGNNNVGGSSNKLINGSDIEDGSIGLDKLADEVKEAIESTGNVDMSEYVSKEELEAKGYLTEHQDLSGYATKEEVGGKVAQDAYDVKISELEERVNEAFTSANNGKQLIANAIGEPLNTEDTFSAMSNDINGLLSTFKTNMMNNGVAVEAGDKFKALIDKIATLAESEGKGIQYLEGIIDINLTTIEDEWVSKTINFNDIGLTFNPTYLFIRPTSFNIDNSEITSILCNAYNNSENNVVFLMMQDITIINGYCYMTTTSESFTLFVHRTIGWTSNDEIVGIIPGIQYYAIGVGEEDTTLRDSLAAILQEEGVSVSATDDMATLIGKVDEEFNRQIVPAGDAVAGNVLSGKTFINNTGQIITGTMTNRGGAQTVTPGTSNKTLNSGYYSGNITVKGDSNLVASNIVSGKSIFGVSGSATTKKFATGTETGSYDVVYVDLDFIPTLILVDDGFKVYMYLNKLGNEINNFQFSGSGYNDNWTGSSGGAGLGYDSSSYYNKRFGFNPSYSYSSFTWYAQE